MIMTKTKEITNKKVTDNGELEQESQLEKINTRIEATTAQYNDAMQKVNQFTDLAKRCLGAIEMLNSLKEELEPKQDAS